MSGRMAWTVARWEFRLLTRGPAFWLAVLAGAGVAVHLARFGVQNPARLAHALAEWQLPILPLLFLPALGAARRRDEAAGIQELVHSRPVSALAWVAGKFAAGWAALALAWLLSLLVSGVVVAVAAPGSLPAWPAVAPINAALVLPGFAFITALCLAVDAATGRTGAVLAAGTAIVLASWLHHPGLWISNLAPLFVPRYVSPVFGFDPYTGVLLANRGWSLALAAGLLAWAVWLLPRRTPALPTVAGRWTVAGLLAVSLAGGGLAATALAAAPQPGRWREAARGWELDQVQAALAGDPRAAAYWVRHAAEVGGQRVQVWLARGHDAAAQPLAEAAAQVLPHFPGAAGPDGTLHVAEGSYVAEGSLEHGALVVLPKDVALAEQGRARRGVLRAMAEGWWARATGMARPWEGYDLTYRDEIHPPELWHAWPGAAALYHQWVVLEQLAGRTALDEELELWRALQDRAANDDAVERLWSGGAAGYGVSARTAEPALVLWAVGERLGHQSVLAALTGAAAELELAGAGPAAAIRAEERYWAAVGRRLGVDLTREPGWPERLPGLAPLPGVGP